MLAKIPESKVFLSGEIQPEYFLHRVNLCCASIRDEIYFQHDKFAAKKSSNGLSSHLDKSQ